MCGLAGIARIDGCSLSEGTDSVLRAMARAVAHRGPDEVEILRSGPVGLAFTRLSLVDPLAGSQPLVSQDGSLVLIANGEIYNHRELASGFPAGTRFQSGSDCEVLLHLYQRDGLRFLNSVRGMFALALWDKRRNQLHFARDRFGVKPLFHHRNGERVVFGSEMKAVFLDHASPRELDWESALADQAMSGAPVFADGSPNTWFKEIELVPAATVVTTDLRTGAVSHHRYWEFPEFGRDDETTEVDFIRTYGELLQESVRECETADVELGIFLSGGIDSAAVAALSSIRPRSFTALNGSTLVNQDAEGGHRAAALLGLDNHQVLFDTRQIPTADEWKQLLWLLESPQCGPEIFYKREMYRFVKEQYPEIKGMLLGGGSDEFNGGYSLSIANGGSWNDFVHNIEKMSLLEDPGHHLGLGSWWDQSSRPLLRREILGQVKNRTGDPYERFFRWKYRDIQQYNCWHEDRTAAGSGIEARVPFLDHRLLELVARIPPELRPSLVWDKRILREAMRDVLPPEFTQRPKVPFFYGAGVHHTYRAFAAMLAREGDALLEEALSSPGSGTYIDVDNARATLRDLQEDPSSGHVEFLLRVVNLGLLEQMTESMPTPPVSAVPAVVPRQIVINDWEKQRPDIEAEVLHRPEIGEDTVLKLPDSVLLLASPGTPGMGYVAVNGTIEYIIDENEAPGWFGLLGSFDGVQSLGQLLSGEPQDINVARNLISDSIELGVLTVENRS
ncbi:asparagine synthase (glutamine-hydrolyzing) [Streptomyces sp. NPDC059853]|uniref:asparagine synthase (glutamine-hydrolyzing) n=1 Tax=Streptomyces sp. NPDC059853 TaxID=3346973 RepID=UPI0036581EBD